MLSVMTSAEFRLNIHQKDLLIVLITFLLSRKVILYEEKL